MGCNWWVWSTKMQYLWRLWALPNDSKHNNASFWRFQRIHCICLRVAQVPGYRDLAIFVLMTDRQTDYFTAFCTCARVGW
jgi:hypothetical protein